MCLVLQKVYELKFKYIGLVGCDFDALKLIHNGRIWSHESDVVVDILNHPVVVAFIKVDVFKLALSFLIGIEHGETCIATILEFLQNA